MVTYPTTFELPAQDRLTGLTTADYFRHLLRENLLPSAKAGGDPLALLLLDMNGFDAINANHGLRCGDRVLVETARMMRLTLPETACIARYSGDEFAAALPNTRLDDAFTVAEELRRQILDLRLEEWPDVHPACGIGLAAYPGNGGSDVELLREATQALYVAKASGSSKVALPLPDSRMVTKTSHYTATQLERLAHLAKTVRSNEASLLREALDDLLKKYNDRLRGAPKE